jgi:4-hydroxy-3-methylbut-2-en-1-yl diphosphate reductase
VLVVGSRNSSNSQRLAELARSVGVTAHLIDGPADIDPTWFQGEEPRETILITAGASAPENLVQQCVGYLQSRFQAEVEEVKLREEEIHFNLPRELRH